MTLPAVVSRASLRMIPEGSVNFISWSRHKEHLCGYALIDRQIFAIFVKLTTVALNVSPLLFIFSVSHFRTSRFVSFTARQLLQPYS